MKHPGRLLLVLALLALPLRAANKVLPEPSHPQPVSVTAAKILQSGSLAKVLLTYYSAAEVQKGVYIGAEYCLACHTGYAKFKDTRHASLLRRPLTDYTLIPDKGVMADQNGNGKDDFIDGLDFNTISSPFDAYKPNAPKLSVKNGTYIVTIGTVDYPVVFTAGGSAGQDQRFAVRVPVTDTDTKFSKANYFAPLSWSAATKKWITNSPTGWYDANNQPKFTATTKSSDLSAVSSHAGCVGCHVTGMKDYSALATGEKVYTGYAATLYAIDNPSYFDYNGNGTFNTVNITCESCHGPGSNHVLGGADPTKIVNPAKLTAQQQTEVCQRCHSSLKSTPNSKWGWPCKDDQPGAPDWYPGAPGSLADWSKDGTAFWPDGVSVKSGHSYGFQKSLHSNNPYEVVTCTVCHDPHQKTTNDFQLRDKMTSADGKINFKTSNEDNTLCLSCHASHGSFANITQLMVTDVAKNEDAIGTVVSAHTHHPYAPERMMGLSNCVTCHMSTTGNQHSFIAMAPEATLKFQAQGGQPNSCAGGAANGCHNSFVNIFGLGLKSGTTWNTTYDQSLATTLQKYYGPGGTWWNTTPKPAVTAAASH
jgi:Doubled CXXCH motif (Paired_CXXCH_1)